MLNFAFFVAFISLTFCEATHNTSRSGSPRKGVCIAPEYYQCSDLAGLPGASWYYNWGTQPSHLSHPECDGVPQPESPGQGNKVTRRMIRQCLVSSVCSHDLGLVRPAAAAPP